MAAPGAPTKGTAAASTTTSVAPTYPASIAANDIVLLVVESYQPSSPGAVSTPAGWTLLGNSPLITGSHQAYVFWRRATGALSGTVTVTRTGTTGNSTVFYAQMYRITGCETSGNPFDGYMSDLYSAGTTPAYPAQPAIGEERRLVALWCNANNVLGTTPTGYTALAGDTTTTGADGGLQLFHKTDARNANTAASQTTAVAVSCATFQISFKPPVTAKSSSDANSTLTEDAKKGVYGSEGRRTSSGVSYGSGATELNDGFAVWNDDANVNGSPNASYAYTTPPVGNPSNRMEIGVSLGTQAGDVLSVFTLDFTHEAMNVVGFLTIDIYDAAGTTILVSTSIELDVDGVTTWTANSSHLTQLNGHNPESGFVVRFSVVNSDSFPWAIGFDAVTASFTYASGTALGFSESQSVTQSGGSTPKSSSDADSPTSPVESLVVALQATDTDQAPTEIVTLAAAESTTDQSGSTTEVVSALRMVTPDTGGDSEAQVLTAQESTSDANGATNELTTLTAVESTVDANGALIENAAIQVPINGTDQNSTTTEASAVSAPVSASDSAGDNEQTLLAVAEAAPDANSTTTESTSQAAQHASADAGSDSETANVQVPIAATDQNGTVVESAAPSLAQSTTDANSVTTEATLQSAQIAASDGPSLTVESVTNIRISDTAIDSATETEAQTLAARPTTTDSNSATTEVQVVKQAKSGSDANSTTTETATPRVFESIVDAGSDSEAQTLVARLTGQDASPSAQEAASARATPGVTDSASGSDTASVRVYVTAIDVSGSTVETAQAVATLVAADAGVVLEAADIEVVILSSDAGATTEDTNIALSAGEDSGSGDDTSDVGVMLLVDDANGPITEDDLVTFIGRLIRPDAEHALASAKAEAALIASAQMATDTRVSSAGTGSTLLSAGREEPRVPAAGRDPGTLTRTR